MASPLGQRGDGTNFNRTESSDSHRPFNGTSSGQQTLAERESAHSRSSSDAGAHYVDLNAHGSPIVLTRTRSRRNSMASARDAEHQDLELDEERMASLIRTLSRKQTTEEVKRSKSRRGPEDPFNMDDPNWDLESFIRAFLSRVRDAQDMPDISSRASLGFSDVVVKATGSAATYQETVGSVLAGPFAAIKGLFNRRKPTEKTILHGVSGLVKEGEMLLVLGRPGAGCSTFLKILGGHSYGYEGWTGKIGYNGVDVATMAERFRGDVVYNPEVDTHFPHLNVGQTLNFAGATHAPRTRLDGETREEFVHNLTTLLTTVLGLRHTLNTKVGDDFVRGVSGGERKRVSIAEMMATRASVGFWDNSTRGLDASTSLEFGTALRISTNLIRNVAIVAIYQAGENLTQLFDKVTILYSGRQIYFGSLAGAKAHFTNMGYVCGPRQTTADFLTAITDPNGRVAKPGWENKVPRTADEFVEAWKKSPEYGQLQADLEEYWAEHDPSKSLGNFKEREQQLKAKNASKKSPYKLSVMMQMKATVTRAYQRMWGDKAFLFATVFSAIFIALINGSVFVNTTPNTDGFFSKGGVLFFAVLYNALHTMSEISTQYAQRPIVEKQKSYAMYHPFTEGLSSMVADWPVKFMTNIVFGVILYFMTGLKKEAGAFFIFLLFTFLCTVTMSAIFRGIAALTKTVESALSIAGVIVLALAVYSGYNIPQPSMHPWFKWISYINPLFYGFEALMANEFHGRVAQCSPMSIVPNGPGYTGHGGMTQVCAVTGAQPGALTVSGDDYIAATFDYHYSHLWRNFGIICGFWIFFLVLHSLATEFNPPPPSKGEFLIFRKGHAPDSVKKALKTGQGIEDIETEAAGAVQVAGQDDETPEEMNALVKSKDIFTWENVVYDVDIPGGERRRLLNNVMGYVKPGTLTALMGESGAGKTTLLNALAQRLDTGILRGDMFVNGSPLDHSFQRRTGYVQQQDLHLAQSTVREALRFSARVRQPRETPLKEKYDYVETIIKLLEMEDYSEAVVGVPGEGLNVEQRKRLTIGVELVAKPALLLFLDEPTSGLDSQSAWSIVRFLRKLALSGQAILCTIHQPSAVLFEQFDRLLLLQKGGKTVYFGDIGENSHTMINYFERNGAHKCGKSDNPAEYILDVIGAGATAKADRDWHEIWKASPEAAETVKEIKRLQAEYAGRVNNDSASHHNKSNNSTFAVSWFEQYVTVQYRMFQLYWRNPTYIMGKLILNIFAGLFLGFTFYKEKSTVQGLQNKIFAIFMSAVLAAPLMNQLQPQFIELSKLYAVREKPSKMYHWSTFVLSNILVEIPYNIVCGTVFFLPWYYAVGFFQHFEGAAEAANRGGYMYYIFVLFVIYFTTFGQGVAAMSPNQQTAAALTSLLFSFVILFNGVLQPLPVLVKFWHWMYHLSPFTYLISGFASNVLHEVPVRCATKELSIFSPPDGSGMTCIEYAGAYVAKGFGYISNPNATENCEYCRYKVGDEFLLGVNMKWSERWRNTGFLWVYIAFNIILVFAFFYLTRVAAFNLADFKAKLGGKQKTPTERPTFVQSEQEEYEMDGTVDENNSPIPHGRQEGEVARGAALQGFSQLGGADAAATGERPVTGNRQF